MLKITSYNGNNIGTWFAVSIRFDGPMYYATLSDGSEAFGQLTTLSSIEPATPAENAANR